MTDIQSDRRVYHRIIGWAEAAIKADQTEECLVYSQVAASFATKRSIGFWRDDKLESLIAHAYPAKTGPPKESATHPAGGRPKIVFVASTLSFYGGHTRIIRTWAERLREECDVFFVLTSNPSRSAAFDWVNPRSVLDPSDSLSKRILALVEVVERERPDRILLFTHPEDIIPLGALSALHHRPRTIFHNHADHLFWVGARIVDRLVSYRSQGSAFAAGERGIPDGAVLPLVPPPPADDSPDPKAVRLLEILRNDFSLSIGSKNKTAGDEDWNFFRDFGLILEENPRHTHLHVSNHTLSEVRAIRSCFRLSNRFVFSGPIADPTPFFARASFLVETYPIAGGTVRAEAIKHTLPLIAVDNLRCALLTDSDELPPDYPWTVSTSIQMVKLVGEFIRHDSRRVQAASYWETYAARVGLADWGASLLRLIIDDVGWTSFAPRAACDPVYLNSLSACWHSVRGWLTLARLSTNLPPLARLRCAFRIATIGLSRFRISVPS